jgi:hypothetical protein
MPCAAFVTILNNEIVRGVFDRNDEFQRKSIIADQNIKFI